MNIFYLIKKVKKINNIIIILIYKKIIKYFKSLIEWKKLTKNLKKKKNY